MVLALRAPAPDPESPSFQAVRGPKRMNADGQWQLAENAADLYEEILVPTVFRPWATDLLQLANLQPGERVLDVACGTGIVARLAARQVETTGEVTGLDLNAGMLQVARSLPPPPGASVTWVEGSALAIPLRDASFDVVLCQQGFQFFPDRAAGLQELKRVLVPGGRILVSIWEGETPYSSAMAAAVEKHVGREPATTLRTSRACPAPETVRDLMVQTGFRDVTTVARDLTRRLPGIAGFVLRHLAATPVAGAIAALSEARRAALGDDVRKALLAYAEGDGIRYQEVAHVVIAMR